MTKPKCRYCNKELQPYKYRADGKYPLPSETLAKIHTADGYPPLFGACGDNAFCSKSCGLWWAVCKLSEETP